MDELLNDIRDDVLNYFVYQVQIPWVSFICWNKWISILNLLHLWNAWQFARYYIAEI